MRATASLGGARSKANENLIERLKERIHAELIFHERLNSVVHVVEATTILKEVNSASAIGNRRVIRVLLAAALELEDRVPQESP